MRIPGTGKSTASPRRNVRAVPSMNITCNVRMWRRVEPKRKEREPEALLAMMPPMDAQCSVGSGGKNWPVACAAWCKSLRVTPAPAVALPDSIFSWLKANNEMDQPRSGMAPPVTPVNAPAMVIGVAEEFACRSISASSCSLVGAYSFSGSLRHPLASSNTAIPQ